MKPCCQDTTNLVDQPSGRPDLALRICAVCGCRHFELSVDAGKLGLVGKGL